MHTDPNDPRSDGEPVDWAYETPVAAVRRDETRTPLPGTMSPLAAPRRSGTLDDLELEPTDDAAWEDLGRGVMVLGLSALAVAATLALFAILFALAV